MKALTLHEAQASKTGPLWVINSSPEIFPPGGDVFITVVGSDDRPVAINVELTWLPKDLSLYAPRKSVLESSFFYKAVNEGLLKIISDSDAKSILNKKGASSEQERLTAQYNAVKHASRAKGIAESVTISGGDQTASQMVDLSDVDVRPEDNISANFKAWVNTTNGLDEEEAISRVKTRGTLTVEECHYLRSNTVHEKIAEVVGRKLKA